MKQSQKRILREAENIGQSLLSKLKKDKLGMYWETLTMNSSRDHVWEVSESIYGGCAGVALYLLELYKHTGKKEYLETAVTAMERLARVCAANEANSEAFFTGRIGVAYVFLKLFDATGNKDHLETASQIARSGIRCVEGDHHVDDLINGSSGVLLALLHLHSYTGESWIEDDVQKIAQHLVERAGVGKRGLYWDKTFQQIQGLCGFSHGAAGLGFVFLELGKYFKDKNCFELAKLAFDYEKTYFVPALNNWQDLRKSFFDAEDLISAKNDFKKGNIGALTKGSDMNAWCHGAAGIGLSRIIASQLLDEPQYKRDLNSCLKKVRDNDVNGTHPQPSFTLCHGTGGNLDLFIEAALQLNDPKLSKSAEKMALKAIDIHEHFGYYMSGFGTGGNKEDISLFMGTAGVGYFLLRVLDPVKTPSILSPVVSAKKPVKSKGVFNALQLKQDILKKAFPKTLSFMNAYAKKDLEKMVAEAAFGSLMKDFTTVLKLWLKTADKKQASVVNDQFKLEQKQFRIEQSTVSRALLFVKYSLLNEEMEETEQKLNGLKLSLNDGITLTSSRYMHVQPETPLKEVKAEQSAVMIKNSHNGVALDQLSDFSYWVIAEFEEAKTFKSALENLIEAFGATSPQDKQQVEQAFTEQVKQAVRSQVLVPAN